MIPEIRTERLILRDWRNEDFPALAEFWMDPVASAYIGGAVKTRGDAWRKMANMVGHWHFRGYGFWILQKRDDPAPLGYCGMWNPEEWPEMEVGWTVFPNVQRQGFAFEAATAVLRYAAALGFSAPISLIHKDNAASRGLAQKLGAQLEREFQFHGVPAQVFRHRPFASTQH